MGGIFKSPSAPPAPEPPPPAPRLDDTAAAAEAERKRQRAAAGRASTVLTSGQGLIGEEQTASKSLLG